MAVVGASTAAPSRRIPMLEFKLSVKITAEQAIKAMQTLIALIALLV